MRFEITEDSATLAAFAAIHEHFRRARRPLLVASVAETMRYADYALWMPNTKKPILTGHDALSYDDEVRQVIGPLGGMQTLMTVKLTQETTPDMVRQAARAGVTGYKGYPDHPKAAQVTTNSHGGVVDYFKLEETIVEIFRQGLVLLTHPETPLDFCLDRQLKFLPVAEFLLGLAKKHRGRLTFEHANTAEMIEFGENAAYDGVLVTITLQHAIDTLDAVVGGTLSPHHFCKPLLRYPRDRDANQYALLSGSPRFAFGSDSAPHFKGEKECDSGCAGCFTAPVVPERLLELVIDLCEGDRARACRVFTQITSENPRRFYELPPPSSAILLAREPYQVPHVIGGAVPYLAGTTLPWTLKGRVQA